jgi:LPXTG-motif cell wall-anchored protein
MRYDIADYTCTVLDYRINSDRLSCTHTFEGDVMIVSVSMVAGWEIDISMLDVGEMEISITDIDGTSSSSYSNMWTFSDSFEFSIDLVEDVTGNSTGMIANQSLVRIGDDLRISGSMSHSLSGMEYQGMLTLRWWGTLHGQSWNGGSTIEVIDGVINATIPMPITGGLLEMTILIMDPYETRTLGQYEVPAFYIDAGAPIILESNINNESRYHLNNIALGVNVLEENGWSGDLTITCQVRSSEVDWEAMTISNPPSTEFQGKFVFSFYFDFSQSGDPTQLSPEARLDCWAQGMDDAGWDLISSTGLGLNEPWMTIPLSNIGPNIELVDVVIEGKTAPGSNLRLELIIQNTGEDLTKSFNITVHTNVSGVRTLIGLYSQSQINNGQGIVKRVSLTVPEGDWTLEVMVDSDQKIWELNEDDNTFSKQYLMPTEDNTNMYIGAGLGIAVLLGLLIVVRRRRNSEEDFVEKKGPSLEDLPRGGPPKDMRRKDGDGPAKAPKKGPPPPGSISNEGTL